MIRDAVMARVRALLVVFLVVLVIAGGAVVALTRGGGEEQATNPTLTTTTRGVATHQTGPFPTATTGTATVPGASTPATPTATPLLGVYRGAAPGSPSFPGSLQVLDDYVTFLGRQPDLALTFQDVDTWANQEWPDWQASAWQALPQYRLVIGGTGAFPQGGTWQEAASGAYDDHWRTLGERLVATGQDDAILRGPHEFNGDWFNYRVGQDDVQDFVTAWRRWVDAMRSVPGQHFTFDWNPILGTQYRLPHAEDAYPGDDYVDHVALDVYDGGGDVYPDGWRPGGEQPSQAVRDAAWNQILNGERGLVFWAEFAKEHGKALSFPEWGIQTWTQDYDGLVHGGGDDAAFVERMADIIQDPTWNVAYHAFWENVTSDEADGVSTPDDDARRKGVTVTESRRVFLERFGGSAPAGSSAAAATATTTGGVATGATTTTAAATSSTVPVVAAATIGTAASGAAFVRGVRFDGPTIQVDGNTFEAADGVATISGASTKCGDDTAAARLDPAVTDAALAELLRCGLQSNGTAGALTVTLRDVANGAYGASVYVWENDFPERYTLALQGQPVADYTSGNAGHWAKLGPFPVTVTDGQLSLTVPTGHASNIAALELRTA